MIFSKPDSNFINVRIESPVIQIRKSLIDSDWEIWTKIPSKAMIMANIEVIVRLLLLLNNNFKTKNHKIQKS